MDPKLQNLKLLRDSLTVFGTECLKVRNKAGESVPFVFNDAQRVLHERLEDQREQHGWIRALILKGRQQGISTYTAARYYHRACMRRGVNVYILSHEQASSDTLFGIVDRYQRNNPIAPHVGTSNAKELAFDVLDSSYAVATAQTKAGGRSKATSLFHGSEVAFWQNASDHFAASVQGVPLLPGTEVILESTSAGAGGEFYSRWQEAEAALGDYIPIFLQWWLSGEYARDPEPGFVLSSEPPDEGEMSEQEYADIFKIDLRRMAWRRSKIHELRSLQLFQREYPSSPSEAWTAPPGMEPYIPPLFVMRARHRQYEGRGPLILGVDPASGGGDRFAVCARRGQRVEWVRYRNKINHLEGTAWIKSLIDEFHPARVNIDAGNIGVDIITNLRTMGPSVVNVVRSVNFGGTSEHKMAKPKVPGPKNRRAEMWKRCKEWLMATEGASLPNNDALQTDLTAPRQKPLPNNDFMLESKKEMKDRGVRSPDLADALVLTFAFNEYFEGYHEPQTPAPFGQVDGGQEPVVQQLDYLGGISPSGPMGWMG